MYNDVEVMDSKNPGQGPVIYVSPGEKIPFGYCSSPFWWLIPLVAIRNSVLKILTVPTYSEKGCLSALVGSLCRLGLKSFYHIRGWWNNASSHEEAVGSHNVWNKHNSGKESRGVGILELFHRDGGNRLLTSFTHIQNYFNKSVCVRTKQKCELW